MAIMPEMFNIRTAAAPLLVASHPGLHFSEGGGGKGIREREKEKLKKNSKLALTFYF